MAMLHFGYQVRMQIGLAVMHLYYQLKFLNPNEEYVMLMVQHMVELLYYLLR